MTEAEQEKIRETVHNLWILMGASEHSYKNWDNEDEPDAGRLEIIFNHMEQLMEIRNSVYRLVREVKNKL